MKTGDTDLIKQINKHRILSALRPAGNLARIEIARTTDLSPATVTALTQELLNEGLLMELTPEPAEVTRQRGRPKVALSLNPDAALVIGTKISMHQISVSVTNFLGEVLAADIHEVRVNRESPEFVANLIEEQIHATLTKLGLSIDKIAGLGIGVPGFVDHVAGVCHWSPVFGDAAIPFRDMMHERLGLPVQVDNDANLITLAEQWFGLGRGMQDFIVVTVEHGVGMGAVIGGDLYRGFRGFSSEFGHTKIRKEGALCRCGQRGCVEAYVAEYAIAREAGAFMNIPDITDPRILRQTMDELAEKARSGDERVAQLFTRAGEALGLGVANLVNLFNPPLIILSGSGIQAFDLYKEAFHEALKTNSLSVEQHQTPVRLGSWDDTVWARGAAALVLGDLFKAPLARPIATADLATDHLQ